MPLGFLFAMLLLTAIATAAAAWRQRHTARQLHRLAASWKMHYVHKDRFNLARRVGAMLPFCGAADVRVSDVAYVLAGDRYQWIFTVQYTRGVIRRHRRVRHAAMFFEPRDTNEGGECSGVSMASASLPLAEQYRSLKDMVATN